MLTPVGIGQTGVIRPHLVPSAAERFGEIIDLALRDAVDDPRFAGVRVDHLPDLLEDVALPHDAIDEVRPIERTDKLLGLLQPQLFDDVVSHRLRGGGRVGVDADFGKPLA